MCCWTDKGGSGETEAWRVKGSAQSIRMRYINIPGSVPVRSSESFVSHRLQQAFPAFLLRYGDAPPFGTTITPLGEQIDPVSYDGRTQYAGVLGDSSAHHV